MTVIGYAVSSISQDLSVQKATLRAAGCKVIRAEKRSGATTGSRKQLRNILESLNSGDVVIVTRIDRLAHSICDLQGIVRVIKAKGASLRATEQSIDTNTVAGTAFLDTLGLFAAFESNIRKERQLVGIAKAKAEGRYKGRPISIDVSKVHELKSQGKGVTDIAREMKIARSSVYRALKEGNEKSSRQKYSRQVPDGYQHQGPLMQCSEKRVQFPEDEVLDFRSEPIFEAPSVSQAAIFSPEMCGDDQLSRAAKKDFEKLRF